VCFYGLVQRSLEFTLENLKRNLLFDDPDVYIHTFDTKVSQSIRGGEPPTPVDPGVILKLNPIKYRIDSEEDFNSTFDFKKYEDYGDPWADDEGGSQTIHNLLRGLHSLREVWAMIDKTKKYDRIIISRADLLFSAPLRLDNIPPNTIITSKHDCDPMNNHNDMFALGTIESLEKWANRLDYTDEFCTWINQLQGYPHHGIHAETFVTYIISRFKIRSGITSIRAIRCRATGEYVV
jgi:hypothetical protein